MKGPPRFPHQNPGKMRVHTCFFADVSLFALHDNQEELESP